jgi:hypothetical protein
MLMLQGFLQSSLMPAFGKMIITKSNFRKALNSFAVAFISALLKQYSDIFTLHCLAMSIKNQMD